MRSSHTVRNVLLPSAAGVLLLLSAILLCSCGSGGGSAGGSQDASPQRTASLVGSIDGLTVRTAGRLLGDGAGGACPDVSVSLDPPSAFDLEFSEDCKLFVTEIPVGTVTVTIEIQGIRHSVTLDDVAEGEVVELEVEVGPGSLDVHVLRWSEPPPGPLPEVVENNDVHIDLPAGYYRQTLTVNGNNFELVGAGCSEESGSSSVIAGAVVVNGNGARFSGLQFLAPVTVYGNNVEFQGCCFDRGLIIVGDDQTGSEDPVDDDEGAVTCGEFVDFEDLEPGASVEGPGAVHLDLEIAPINASRRGLEVVAERAEPAMYTAPQVPVVRVPNGCLGNPGGWDTDEESMYGQGFANLDGVHEYLFTILNGKSVNRFEITMLDFGDYNPDLVRNHTVELVGYALGSRGRVEIDRDDSFAYQSLAQELPSTPTAPDQGDLQVTGDACTARPGDPGNYTFQVQGQGMTYVVLRMVEGPDPQVVFDNIRFELEQVDIDVIPTINLKSNGVIPVAILGNSCFDVQDIDVTTVKFGPDGAAPKHLQHGEGEDDDCDEDAGEVCDHNDDGNRDLILHFPTQETGIEADDTEACLTGTTQAGVWFEGCDRIRIAPGSSEPDKDKDKDKK